MLKRLSGALKIQNGTAVIQSKSYPSQAVLTKILLTKILTI